MSQDQHTIQDPTEQHPDSLPVARRTGRRSQPGRTGRRLAAADGIFDPSGSGAGLALAAPRLAAAVAVGTEVGRRLVALGRGLVAGRLVRFGWIAHAIGLPVGWAAQPARRRSAPPLFRRETW